MMAAVQKKRRRLARSRRSRIESLRDHPKVDAGKLGAIGYCFGGASVLHDGPRRVGCEAVVSFHGSLPKVSAAEAKKITAKVLICHGR